MRNVFVIVRQEIVTLLTNRTFWIMTTAFPALILLFNLGTFWLADDAGSDSGSMFGADDVQTLGYVDQSGVIRELPPGIPAGMVLAYPSVEAGEEALADGEVDALAILPADFVESGEITVVQAEFNPFSAGSESFFSYLAAYNLTGDVGLAAGLQGPLNNVTGHDLAPAEPGEEGDESSSPIAGMVPFAVLFIFFFLLTMSSGYMLSSVSREKENRTVEVLLVSVSPRQLMLGKLIGLSIIALLQMLVWVGGSFLILQATGLFNLPPIELGLPASFFIWGVIYLVLGYLLYASMMGAVGALAPNAREAGQFTFAIILPLMIPLWFNFSIMEDPGGTLATVLSLIPLTAPVTMMTRLAVGDVPLWQLLVSVGLLAVTTYGFVLLSSRFFRADTLLSNATLKWNRLLTAWRNPA
ncbi:MAG: ABC transporter permease [Chloroflexi bacterium]|mgnify:CR=1 FL=1|jgi:ABC-2 type transport system permease protein|nr:ABC transporter permease [Chloroflexota bacterium]